MNPLTISLFGGLQVLPPGAERPLPLAPSARALLAFLLVQQHPVSRDVLMDVFWVETPPERARSNLTSAVYRLRQQLEADQVMPGTYLLSRRNGEVGFNWESPHWIDSRVFAAQIDSLLLKPLEELCADDVKGLEAALTLYRGDLLEGIYDDWALREQEHFRSLYLHCLTRLMRYYANCQAYEQGIRHGQAILRKEPLHEETQRALMRLYQANGQNGLALRQYEKFRALLQRELDLLPLDETQALARQIVIASHVPMLTTVHAPNVEVSRLLHELETVKQHLSEVNRLLEHISRAVENMAGGNDHPVT